MMGMLQKILEVLEDVELDAGDTFEKLQGMRATIREAAQEGRGEVSMSRRVVYLASPYSHDDRCERFRRAHLTAHVAARILEIGVVWVLSPIVHTHPIIQQLENLPAGLKAFKGRFGTFEHWKEFDRFLINACDELWILTLDGWAESVGIKAEVRIALELGKPIYLVDADGIDALCPRRANLEGWLEPYEGG